MKRVVNIMWVDDKINKSNNTLSEVCNDIKNEIEKCFYDVNIINKESFKEAESLINKLENQRIDLVVSDFNLEEENSGLDLLVKLRENKNHIYFILYSNNDKNEIVERICEKLKSKKEINLFSNFDFFSLENYDTFQEHIRAVEFYMSERKSLNELRNIIIVEHTLINDALERWFNNLFPSSGEKFHENANNDYKKRIDSFVKLHVEFDKDVLDKWHLSRKYRNILAHGLEEIIDKKIQVYQTTNGEKKVIKETEFSRIVRELKKISCYLREKHPEVFSSES